MGALNTFYFVRSVLDCSAPSDEVRAFARMPARLCVRRRACAIVQTRVCLCAWVDLCVRMLQYKTAMILHSQVREDVVGCLLTDVTTTLISILSLLTSAVMIGHKAAHFEIMKLNWDQTSRLHDERVKLLAQLGRTESPGADVESPGAAVA